MSKKLDDKEFRQRVEEINPFVQVLTTYEGLTKPVTFKCECGEIYTFAEARALLMGQKCSKCKSKRIRFSQIKSNETFIRELHDKYPQIVPLDEYQGSHHKIKYRCAKCGFEHQATPTNLLSGFGCPNCSSSKGETAIRNFLLSHNINFEAEKFFSDCRDKLPLRFDFYIPQGKILIEYQGEQHYKARFDWAVAISGTEAASFTTLQKHDEIKRTYCKKHNYNELEIKYSDLKNIDNILENYLKEKGVMPE